MKLFTTIASILLIAAPVSAKTFEQAKADAVKVCKAEYAENNKALAVALAADNEEAVSLRHSTQMVGNVNYRLRFKNAVINRDANYKTCTDAEPAGVFDASPADVMTDEKAREITEAQEAIHMPETNTCPTDGSPCEENYPDPTLSPAK